MNREILFRGKRTDNGEWIEGYPVFYPSGKCIFYKKALELPDSLFYCEVDPSTVCQYTGLTDLNGVKVYEGDIIQGYDGLFAVDYRSYRACFMAVGIGTEIMAYLVQYMMRSDFEVVGNKWDNHELLKHADENMAQYADNPALASTI